MLMKTIPWSDDSRQSQWQQSCARAFQVIFWVEVDLLSRRRALVVSGIMTMHGWFIRLGFYCLQWCHKMFSILVQVHFKTSTLSLGYASYCSFYCAGDYRSCWNKLRTTTPLFTECFANFNFWLTVGQMFLDHWSGVIKRGPDKY